MAGRKRNAPGNSARNATTSGSSRRTRTRAGGRSDVPDVYRDMLAEVEVQPDAESPERPIKRRRPGQRSRERPQNPATTQVEKVPEIEEQDEDEEEEDVEFEDISLPVAAVQTIERDTDEEEEEEEDDDDLAFEDVDLPFLDIDSDPIKEAPKGLELDLSIRTAVTSRKAVDRRKPINKTEKDRRVEIHKTHLLCLLSHVSRRNRWCNDPTVQKVLRPLLTKKMVTYLNPSKSLPQFGQTQSLKNGLQEAISMFNIKFKITERGMRRALWAENEENLKNVNILHLACYG